MMMASMHDYGPMGVRADIHYPRSGIHIHDSRSVGAGTVGGIIVGVNLTVRVDASWARVIYCGTDDGTCSSTDDCTFSPSIIVVPANQRSRDCPQHRRLAHDGRTIDFCLRRADSSHRERKRKE
jgi:hypothetical protein